MVNMVASLYYYLHRLAPAVARESEPSRPKRCPPEAGVLLAPAVARWVSPTAVLAGALAPALDLAAGGLLAVLGGSLAC